LYVQGTKFRKFSHYHLICIQAKHRSRTLSIQGNKDIELFAMPPEELGHLVGNIDVTARRVNQNFEGINPAKLVTIMEQAPHRGAAYVVATLGVD
jgi:hypothetical protein